MAQQPELAQSLQNLLPVEPIEVQRRRCLAREHRMTSVLFEYGHHTRCAVYLHELPVGEQL
jgi:hypothetical protein